MQKKKLLTIETPRSRLKESPSKDAGQTSTQATRKQNRHHSPCDSWRGCLHTITCNCWQTSSSGDANYSMKKLMGKESVMVFLGKHGAMCLHTWAHLATRWQRHANRPRVQHQHVDLRPCEYVEGEAYKRKRRSMQILRHNPECVVRYVLRDTVFSCALPHSVQ